MDFRNRNIDLVGKQNLWFGISLALVLVGMISWAMFGLNLGIDFKGGTQLQYRLPYSQRPTGGKDVALVQEVRDTLEKKGLRGAQVQIAGGDTLVINAPALSQSQQQTQQRLVYESLSPRLKGTNAEGKPQELRLIGQQFVGPVIGEELKRNAIVGVILGVFAIATWIFIRYNFAGDGLRYAVAGIFALVHDVLVLLGMFALIGYIDPRIEIDGAFIAALLTVVGYSINDSVVIFDRIRENLRLRRNEPFNKVVNDSLLETMSRSVNTGLTVLIMLFALLFLGGDSIYNFVLAMLLGIASGLYSSIFNASMVLTAWHNWDEKKRLAARGAAPLSTQQAPRMATATAGNRNLSPRTVAPTTSTDNAPRRATFASTKPSKLTPRTSGNVSEETTSDEIELGEGEIISGAASSEGGSSVEGGSSAESVRAARASRKARSRRRY